MRIFYTIALFFIITTSFKTDFAPSLISSCTTCATNSIIDFTGSGYPTRKEIGVNVQHSNGNPFMFSAGQASASGNITFSVTNFQAGDYTFTTFYLKGNKQFNLASVSLSIE